MCKCALGEIIVDERVYEASRHLLLFHDHGTVNAKGYADPVQIYIYVQALLSPRTLNIRIAGESDTFMVGRSTQLESLKLGLNGFLTDITGCQKQFYLIEGEEGVGTCTILKYFANNIRADHTR
jgi:hypothetical protein